MICPLGTFIEWIGWDRYMSTHRLFVHTQVERDLIYRLVYTNTQTNPHNKVYSGLQDHFVHPYEENIWCVPGDTFANEQPELSKQSVSSSSALLTLICAGLWHNNWQTVTLCCSVNTVQVLNCSDVDAVRCVNLLVRRVWGGRVRQADNESVTCWWETI